MPIAWRDQLLRSTTATVASDSTCSGSCQVGRVAAWSPPRIRNSSSPGDASISPRSVSEV
jgi:hypothetical protein